MTTALLVLASAIVLGAALMLVLRSRERARRRSLATASGALDDLERRLEASRRRLAEADARRAALRDAPELRVDPAVVVGPTDTLTGLEGRTAFLEGLARELEHGSGDACTLLLLAVDASAEVTAQRPGDSALAALAELLRDVGDDCAEFRVGADTFALIFPGGGLGAAEQAFARLRAALRRGALARGVVVTGGIASAQPGDRALELLLRADEALRQAKRDARGSAVVGAARTSSAIP